MKNFFQWKRVVVVLNGIESEPIYDVPADDSLTTLQAGEKIEAFFKSLDEVKQLIITSIDCNLNDVHGGYDVTITTQEYDPGLTFIPNDPSSPINNLDKDIETIIYSCDCAEFKRRNGIDFDSQDAYEQGWKNCPCCNKPFKTRKSKSISYNKPSLLTPEKIKQMKSLFPNVNYCTLDDVKNAP
jgi:hypothetical protein